MRAMVAGGAGMIGSHLVDLLLAEGWDVSVLDSLDPQTHPSSLPPEWLQDRWDDLGFFGDDIRDEAQVAKAMRGCDVVFHQAAFGGFTDETRRYGDVNVGGTAVVMDAARHAGVSRVVVASSQAVYGPGWARCAEGYFPVHRTPEQATAGQWEPLCPFCGTPGEVEPVREDQLLLPKSPYALSKWHEEKLALELGAAWGLPVTALRYGLCFGPRQSVSNPYTGVCSIFATRLRNGLPPVVYEDGLQTRDFVYVGDVARANLLAATDDRAVGEVFNVGTGVATTMADFAWQLALALEQTPAAVVPGRWRPHDVRHLVTDASRLRALGWEPEVPLRKGLRRYADWFLAQPAPPEVFTDAEAGLADAGIVRNAS